MLKEVSVVIMILIATAITAIVQNIFWQPITPVDFAFNLSIEIVGAGITILILDQLFYAEERKKWKAVKSVVMTSIKDEIYYIFIDFAGYLVPLKVFTGTTKQIAQQTHEYKLREIRKLASGQIAEIEKRLRNEKNLLNGGYGNIFQRRHQNLSDIVIKYGKFLDPSTYGVIIPLENLLRSLQSSINVKLKLAGQTGAFMIPAFEQKIFIKTQAILKKLDESEKLGFIEYQE